MNMHDPNTPAESDESRPELPDALAGALRRIHERSPGVPPETDDVIRAAARSTIKERMPSATTDEPRRKVIAFPGSWTRRAAAAAVVLLLAGLATRIQPNREREQTSLDRPTILDAFALARRLQAGEQPDAKFDVNGDGGVDLDDVNLLAQRAVSLPEGGAL